MRQTGARGGNAEIGQVHKTTRNAFNVFLRCAILYTSHGLVGDADYVPRLESTSVVRGLHAKDGLSSHMEYTFNAEGQDHQNPAGDLKNHWAHVSRYPIFQDAAARQSKGLRQRAI